MGPWYSATSHIEQHTTNYLMVMIETSINHNIVFNMTTGPTTYDIVECINANIDDWIEMPVLWDITNTDLGANTTEGWIDILRQSKSLAAKRTGPKTALLECFAC